MVVSLVKGMHVVIAIGEVPQRTAGRAEQNREVLKMTVSISVLWKPAEPLVVHDLRPTNDATRAYVAVALKRARNFSGGERDFVCGKRGVHTINGGAILFLSRDRKECSPRSEFAARDSTH